MKFVKFQEYFKNKPRLRFWKECNFYIIYDTIIKCAGNLYIQHKYVFKLTVFFKVFFFLIIGNISHKRTTASSRQEVMCTDKRSFCMRSGTKLLPHHQSYEYSHEYYQPKIGRKLKYSAWAGKRGLNISLVSRNILCLKKETLYVYVCNNQE